MADKITVYFTCLYLGNKFLTCSLCTPEGKKGRDVVSKDAWFLWLNQIYLTSPSLVQQKKLRTSSDSSNAHLFFLVKCVKNLVLQTAIALFPLWLRKNIHTGDDMFVSLVSVLRFFFSVFLGGSHTNLHTATYCITVCRCCTSSVDESNLASCYQPIYIVHP